MVSTRFNPRIPYFILIASICSLMLSLFLLELFAGLLSVLWLFEHIKDKRKAFDVYTVLIVIFGLVRIASIVFSQYPSVSAQSYYKDALFYFSFFAFSFYLKALGREKLISAVKIFAASSIAIAVVGLVLFNLKLADRAQSFSSGYATFSSYLLVGLGITAVLQIKEKIKYGWLYRAAGLGLILAGIITSMGRTNIAIAILVTAAALVLRTVKIKPAIVIAAVAVVVSLLSFQNNKAEITRRVENPTVLSDRNILLEGAKALVLEHPLLGFGPRTFHNIFPYRSRLSDKGIGSWHNDFIQVYFESGILGLVAFITIIVYFMLRALLFIREKKSDAEFKIIVTGILLGFTALILSALTAGFIDSPVLSVLFAFLIAALSSVIYLEEAPQQNN